MNPNHISFSLFSAKLYFFLFPCKLHLRQENGAEHEDTAENFARGGESPEDDCLGNGGEEGLKAHNERADRRLGVFLTNRLKRVRHAAGKHARKENGEECRSDLVGVEALEKKHGNRGKNARNKELNAGELEAIHARRKAVDGKNLESERHRAHEREEVTEGDASVIARDAEQIKSAYGKCNAEPEVRADLLFHEKSDNGDEDDIHGSDKACLACRGAQGNADLLKAGGNAKAEAADDAAED